jgi:hypothetical protein
VNAWPVSVDRFRRWGGLPILALSKIPFSGSKCANPLSCSDSWSMSSAMVELLLEEVDGGHYQHRRWRLPYPAVGFCVALSPFIVACGTTGSISFGRCVR